MDLLHSSEGHMIAKVSGKNVAQAFQNESGKHVVQRIPSNGKGSKHTSFVSVMILPLPPEKEMKPLAQSDLDIKTQKGHGPGGQNVNKTDSAVRMKHKPTGLQVVINGRDQYVNKRDALRILTAKVNEHYNDKEQTSHDANRLSQTKMNRGGDKTRTYNFLNSRVVDHNTGKKTRNIKAVMKGDFSLIK